MNQISISVDDLLNKSLAVSNKYKYQDLSMINLIMTRRCNFDCTYCPEDKDQANIGDWTPELFKSLLQFCARESEKKSVMLSFFGGEPLLKWKLIKELLTGAVDDLKNLDVDFTINISTNVFLLDAKKQKWLSDFSIEHDINTGFLLSIDTFLENNTQRIQKKSGETGLDTIIANLDYMKEHYPNLMKSSSFRVSLMHDLVYRVEEDMRIMVGYNPASVIVHPITTHDKEEDLWTQDLWDMFEQAVNNTCMYALMTSNVAIECMEGVSERGGNCGAGSTMLGADSSGDLYSCYFTAHDGDKTDAVASYVTGDHYEQGHRYIDIVYDKKCDSCDMEYCHQCHIKNVIHTGDYFCPASWCVEIATMYKNTKHLCDLTTVNSWNSPDGGLTMATFHEKISCDINSIAVYLMGALKGEMLEPEEHCGCELAEGSITEALEILANLDLLKLTAQKTMLNSIVKKI